MSVLPSSHEVLHQPLGLSEHLWRAQQMLESLRGSGNAVQLPVAIRHTAEREDIPRRGYNLSGLLGNDVLVRTEPPGAVRSPQLRRFSLLPDRLAGIENLQFDPMELEDPAIAIIDDEIVVSGVHVVYELINGRVESYWYTKFFRGPDLNNQKHFANSPWGEKDNRLIQRSNGRKLLLTRPRGGRGGLGTIGCVQFDDLNELNPMLIADAPMLNGMFMPEEWGGANQMYELEDGWIGVLGHIADKTPAPNSRIWLRRYFGMVFELEPDDLIVRNFHIIADAAIFPDIEPWIPDLPEAIFPAGLEFYDKSLRSVRLLTGVNDNGVGVAEIPYPFSVPVNEHYIGSDL